MLQCRAVTERTEKTSRVRGVDNRFVSITLMAEGNEVERCQVAS